MVCLGNICRSPSAEAVLRSMIEKRGLGDEISVDSAGTYDYHAGEAPDPRAQATARRRGYSMAGQFSRKVEPADFRKFDYLLAMDRGNLRDLLDRCPEEWRDRVSLFLSFDPGAIRDEVPDPYAGGRRGFEDVLDIIEAASNAFLDHLCKSRGLGSSGG